MSATILTRRIEVPITGMTCASCARRVERRLNELDGVAATVNYATETAAVEHTAGGAEEIYLETAAIVSCFLLHNRHEPADCGAVYTAFKGHPSPLRRTHTASSCRSGGHEIWWLVDAEDVDAALALLPRYVARGSTVTPVRRVRIP